MKLCKRAIKTKNWGKTHINAETNEILMTQEFLSPMLLKDMLVYFDA